MATSDVQIDEGTEVKLASYSITEDASAKEIGRAVLNTSAGVEISPLTDTQLRATAVPVSVSGVATSAKQDTGNTSLASIDGKVVLPASLGQKVKTASLPVVLASDQDAVPVTGTFYQVTQPVSAASLPLPTGAATAANQQTDALTDTELRATPVPVSVSGVATSAKQDTIIGHVDGIEGLLTTIDGDTGNISTKIDTLSGAVAGTEMQVDVVAALPAGDNNIGNVDLASAIPAGTNNIGDVDVLTVPSDPFGANADAAATAGSTGSIQAKLRLVTSQLDAIKTSVETIDNTVGGSELQVDIVSAPTLTVNAHAVTNAGTFAVQESGAALTSLQLIDDTVATDGSATPTKGILIAGQDGTNAQTIKTDSSGELQIDVLSIAAGDNNIGNVDIASALPAGTNAIGKLAANSGVDIGDVDVTSAVITGGAVAHDGADSGNPIKVGAKASATLSNDTMVADGDRTDAISDIDGAIITRAQYPLGDMITERVSNTDGASTAFSNFGGTASTRSVITAVHAFRTDAGTTPIYVDFRDGTGGSILYSVVLPPNGGAVLPAGATAYFRTSANTALAYDVSAATTTVYISLTGFKSKV